MTLSELIESLNHLEKDPDTTAEDCAALANELYSLAATLERRGLRARAYAEVDRASELMKIIDQLEHEEMIYGTYESQVRSTYYGGL